MPSVYRTARGKNIDLDVLRLSNETTVAVGNQRVNARGDQLGVKGQVVKTNEERMSEIYRNSGFNVPSDTPVYDSQDHITNNLVQEDVIDQAKLKTVIDDLTKKIKEKDAVIASMAQKASTTENFDPLEEVIKTMQPPQEPANETPLRGGLANAIQKDKEYKEKTQPSTPRRI